MIRKATNEDLPEVLIMLTEFYKESGHNTLGEVNYKDLSQFVRILISDHILIVAEKDRELVGVTGAVLSPMYWNVSNTIAQELFWWIAPKHRRGGVGLKLFEGLEEGVKETTAKVLVMASVDRLNGLKVGKFYESQGYAISEHTYVKRF